MKRKYSALMSLVVLVGIFVSLVVVNNQLLSHLRFDLTQNNVYSLSAGSKAVIQDIEEPITLYFFFSDDATKGMTALRNYANRVQSLLEEYVSESDGKITLQVIDPEPFSEAEDRAAEFGLTGASVGSMGDTIYLGLAGTNALDDQFVIGFFDPQKEQFLEYEISKLIYQLSDPDPIHLALVTDMQVAGGQNPMTGQFTEPMAFYTQLSQLYRVSLVDSSASQLPEDTDILMLANPKNLSKSLLYDIDQFAMTQGNVLVLADPVFESDPAALAGGGSTTDFPLLEKWGIHVDLDHVVLDPNLGLEIRSPEGAVVRHSAILGLTDSEIDRDDIVTANLDIINGASFGEVAQTADSQLAMTPLIQSSEQAVLIDSTEYQAVQDPQDLRGYLDNQAQQYTLAARFSGAASSAFDTVPEGVANTQHKTATDALNVIVVADADLLANRFWVQMSNFFGETISTPFANNGDLIVNATDNLAGSSALISVRSRGKFARPFDRVKALEVKAEAKFRQHEEMLQQQLNDTEQQLAQLQGQQGQGGALALTPEQQAAIDSFVEQRLTIRKQLREVQYQLKHDIDALGNWLKFINIAVMPLCLVLLLWMVARKRQLRSHGRFTLQYKGEA